MRRLLGFLVFLAIVIVAFGLWRGWFTIFVNKPQIEHDTQRIERKIERETDKLKQDVNTGAKKVEQNTDGN